MQIHDVIKFGNASTNSQRERPRKVPVIFAEAESAQQTEQRCKKEEMGDRATDPGNHPRKGKTGRPCQVC